MAAGEERSGPYRGSSGSLALSLLAAWLLVGSQRPVQACGNPFDALMCPTAGCSCGDAPWPGSSGISAWLSYPEPGGPGSSGGPGGCGPCGTGGAAGGGGPASKVPRWQRYWPSWGGGGGGELGWPPVRGEDGPQIHPRPYGRPSLSVTARNQQAVVYDIPLWYAPATGPAVEMRLAYNNWDKRYDDPTPADPPSSHLEMASWPVGRGWTLLYTSTATFTGESYRLYLPRLSALEFVPSAAGSSIYVPGGSVSPRDRLWADSATGLLTYLSEPQGEQLIFEPDPGVSGRYRLKYHYSTRLQPPTTVNYDAVSGDITTVVAADGTVFSFTYDSAGHITLIQDPFGRSTVLAYSGNSLVGIADMASQAFAFTYDAGTGLLTSMTDNNSRTTSLSWSPGSSIAVTDPEGQTTSYLWGGIAASNPAQVIGPGGNVVSRELLTKWNLVLWREDPLGNRTYFDEGTMPGEGSFVEEVSPAGTITRTFRIANGYRTARKVYDPPAGGISLAEEYGQEVYVRTTVGALLSDERWESTWYADSAPPMPSQVVHRVLDPATGATLEQTTRTYGRLDAGTPAVPWDDVYPLLSEKRLASDGGTPAEPGDDVVAEIRWDYDSAGRLSAVRLRTAPGEEPAAFVTVQSYSYTTAGRLAEVVDVATGTWDLAWSTRGLVESVTGPGNLVTSFTYDGLDRVVRTDLPGGAYETQTYDCCGLASRTDAAGEVTVYTRVDGRLVAESRHSPGNVSLQSDTFEYDDQGHLTSRTDALGNTTGYTYDRLGRQTAVTGADGSTTRTYYDAEGRPVSEVDALGHRTETAYDRLGRVVQRRAAFGGQMVVLEATSYDGAGRVAASTDALGNTTQFQLDGLGRTTRVTYPDGMVSTSVYNLLGRVVSRTLPHPSADPTPPTVTTAYDAVGRTLSVTDPAGHIAAYQYHADFREAVTQVTAQADAQATPVTVLTAVYDSLGRRASETREGTTVQFSYTTDGRPLRTTFADASYTETSYDGRRVTASRDRAGNVTTYGYDAIGRRTTITDARGKSTVTAYAADTSRPTSVTDPLGNVTGYEYDPVGRLVRVIHPGSGTEAVRTTLHTYDELGRRTAIDGARTYPLQYEYDLAGRLTGLVDGEGNRTEWSFDVAGRLVRKTYADGSHYDYTYDDQGRLLSRADALGKVTSYVYNDSGQVVLVDYPPAGSGAGEPGDADLSYTYDALGRLAARTDAAGTWAWVYDGNTGRVLTLTDPDGNVVSYTYDAAGQRDSLTLTAAGQQQPTMELDYSYVAGRLAGIAASETVGGVSRSAAYAYSYLANSNLLATVVSNNGSADVLALGRSYDDAGRLLSIAGSRSAPLGPACSFTYGLDELGRRISRTDLDGSRLDYTYNPRDELTGAVRSNQPAAAPFGEYPYSYGYEFDRIGNHLRQTKNGTEFRGRYNNLNELVEREIAGAVRVQGAADGVLPIGVKVDGRDAQTQNVDADTAAFRGDSPLRPRQTGEKAISIVATDSNQPPKRTEAVRAVQLPPANPLRYGYDANGNLVSDGVWSYTWTTECRLAAIAPLTPADQAVRLEFVYDGEGRRRWRKSYTWDAQAEDWVLAAETTFLYDGWNLIRKTTTDHTQTPAAVSARGYVWGLDLSQTLQGAGGVGGLLSISLADRSSFVAYDGNGNVAALVDAASGAVSAEYDYSPFGETLKATGAAADSNPFRFSTKYSEQPTSGPELYYFGLRFYSPGLGRWMSRDPIGEEGGASLYHLAWNAPTYACDYLGLWGYVPCDFAQTLSDTGWQFDQIAPDETFVRGGTTGGGTSDGVVLAYRRRVVDLYVCTCCWLHGRRTEMRVVLRGYEARVSAGAAGGSGLTGLLWNGGVPGTWPPLPHYLIPKGVGTILGTLLKKLVSPPTPAFSIDGMVSANHPSPTEAGVVVDDTGVPQVWCWF